MARHWNRTIIAAALMAVFAIVAMPLTMNRQTHALVASPAALTECDPLTDDFEDGSLSEWTQSSGCSAPWSIATQGSGNKYATVSQICACTSPASIMMRTDCSYDDGYVECTIIQFGGGSSCTGSNTGGPVLRAGETVDDPFVTVAMRSSGVRIWVWDGETQINVYIDDDWPLAVGDRVRVELVGDTMHVIHYPGPLGADDPNETIEVVDDAMDIGSGYCGLRVAHTSSGTGFDDYESGPLP